MENMLAPLPSVVDPMSSDFFHSKSPAGGSRPLFAFLHREEGKELEGDDIYSKNNNLLSSFFPSFPSFFLPSFFFLSHAHSQEYPFSSSHSWVGEGEVRRCSDANKSWTRNQCLFDYCISGLCIFPLFFNNFPWIIAFSAHVWNFKLNVDCYYEWALQRAGRSRLYGMQAGLYGLRKSPP